jgi:FtsP/CotA-like multicopper oxidase with cupredoxin domain
VTRERWRLLVAVGATLALLGPLGWMWQASRLPDSYGVMDMGVHDYGGGPVGAHGSHGGATGRSVADLVETRTGAPDVSLDLVARKGRFRLQSGEEVDGFTLNGSSPGPVITAVQGQLVEVRLRNESVPDGVTLHWHGVDVPGAVDGVAGVTQDAVRVGGSHTYRFVAEDAGTYWYHSHQVSHEQVQGGLLGALVVTPRAPQQGVRDVLALSHVYDGRSTLNGSTRDLEVDVAAGTKVRVRVVNTDNGEATFWPTGEFRVLAVDGTDVNGPQPVRDRLLRVTAGGRMDVEVTAPARVRVGGGGSVVVGDAPAAADRPEEELDLLSYGTPAPLGLDATRADRTFRSSLGRRPGFVDGRPGMWWSINGRLFPDVPMYVVAEGDVVRMTIENHSREAHPMHLHGHHAVVLSRDGVAATGSPWWVDSLDVGHGETYEIAFVADNPGVWMDHCHNLPHAAEGLVAHLMYEGVTVPYRLGGPAGNEPE